MRLFATFASVGLLVSSGAARRLPGLMKRDTTTDTCAMLMSAPLKVTTGEISVTVGVISEPPQV